MKTASLLAGAFLALASTAALAQPGPGSPETRQFGDFQVRCFQVQGGSPCDMFEQVRNKETGQPLINFSIAFLPSNNRYVMVLGVPLGGEGRGPGGRPGAPPTAATSSIKSSHQEGLQWNWGLVLFLEGQNWYLACQQLSEKVGQHPPSPLFTP